MNVNVDCVREIMLFTENELGEGDGFSLSNYFVTDLVHKYSKDEVYEAIDILIKDGYLDGNTVFPRNVLVRKITINGQLLLSKMRNMSRWDKIKLNLIKLPNKLKMTSLSAIAFSN